jgi:hypothetical protein
MLLTGQQRFDFRAQGFVTGTGLSQEGSPLAGFQL